MRNRLNEWMTVTEVAREKGVAASSVRLAVLTGRLEGEKKGRTYLISRRSARLWQPSRRGPRRREPGAD